MSEEKKMIINEKDFVACNYFEACDYFKNMKRLQKENEKLKERFNELYNNAEQLANKYNKYGGNKENELVEIINKTTDEMNKYKQALEEIREMVNEQKPPLDKVISQSEFTIEKLCDYDEKYIKIVGKINEVLNDRD